jgi:ATP-binding cassette subfamily C protein CydD
MDGIAAAERIFSILSEQLPHRPVFPASSQFQKKIEFDFVSFSYAQGDHPAVRDVSFLVGKGENIALVGPSGAGKSTLASLLLGFIQPQAGEILVDDVSLQTFEMNVWRSKVAWVSQNPYLFYGTVEENLRFANPHAAWSQIEAAVKNAYIHEFIQSLPQKYQTRIGERGLRISSGQAQRLALARAFLKDAPILLLDEPTSHLDPATEKDLQVAIYQLMANRTALIIAHRLNSIIAADRIVVLDKGRVVQQGTYSELLNAGGLLSQMVGVSQ